MFQVFVHMVHWITIKFIAPLSTTLIGAISGSVTCVGAAIVDCVVPYYARPFLVCGLFGSAILYSIGHTYSECKDITKLSKEIDKKE